VLDAATGAPVTYTGIRWPLTPLAMEEAAEVFALDSWCV